jgi:hypothetical protein
MRLRQMQSELPFQSLPHGLQVLRGRFHYRFLHAVPGQPVTELDQVARSGAEFAALKPEFTVCAASVITTASILLAII